MSAMLEMQGWKWKQDVLDTVNDRFERRLTEESAALRLQIAAVRLEIAKSHAGLLKWQVAQWLTLMLAIFATRIWA